MNHWISQPDAPADADIENVLASAQAAVRIRLKDYDRDQESASDEAEARYRKTLERMLGGPVEVAAALRAYLLACENDAEEIDAADRALAETWIKASQRANVDGLSGLVGADEAWFEVTASKLPAVLHTHPPRRPAVAAVAAAPLYAAPPAVVVELPTDWFPVKPSSPQLVAACEKAPARTRTRTQVAEPFFSPQLDLF